MTSYKFACVVGTEVIDSGGEREFEDIDDARREARALLGRMAAHALATRDVEMISVDIFDDHNTPLAELRLTFEEIPK